MLQLRVSPALCSTYATVDLELAANPTFQEPPLVSKRKRVLYEQVTDVNVFPFQGLCFCCCRCGCCCSPPGLYSHSDESDESGLGAGWGSSRCCYLSDGLGRPKRARSHRNTVSTQRVNRIIFRRPVDRTGCKVPVWSRGDGARRPTCGRPPRRTYSSPACRLWQPSAAPTVEVLSLDRVVAGCGWHTLSADFEDKGCQPCDAELRIAFTRLAAFWP